MASKLLLAIGLLAVVGVLLVQVLAGRSERRAEAAFPPEGTFVEVEGLRIHGVVAGTGPDLVLIHGASSNTRDFTFALLPELSARYRVIALDRPGFGHSDPPSEGAGSLADQARILSQAAAQFGAEAPIVLGHSYGGAVAMAWGLAHPASALVIESGATMVWPTGIDRIYRILGSRLGGWTVAPLASAFLGGDYVDRAIAGTFAPSLPPEGFSAHLGGALALRRSTLRVNARQRLTLKEEIRSQSARYGEIDLPVEVLHGDADKTVSLEIHARGLLQVLPNAELTVLPGIGHNPHNVVPEAIVAAIDRAAARAGLAP